MENKNKLEQVNKVVEKPIEDEVLETKINHPDMVKQLAKSGADIVAQLTPNSAHLLHMAVGISGESGEILQAILCCENIDEVDEENIIEELGDMEFYLEGYRQEMGFKRIDTLPKCEESFEHHGKSMDAIILDSARLSAFCSNLLDQTKKMAIYVKPINAQAVMDELKIIETYMESIRQHFGVLHEECLEHNVEKLGKRYKGHNYSNEQAQDRADKSE